MGPRRRDRTADSGPAFYYDQRIRQEGFDIELMMQAAGMNAGGSVPGIAVASRELPA
jgi:hypothetical protein